MRRGISWRLVALGCALMVVLSGCELMAGGDKEPSPPLGGWPQPAGERVTEKMCGLLTKADYSRVGHDGKVKSSGTVNTTTNTVNCRYESADAMTLSLRPTAAFAKYVFAAGLADHKRQLTNRRQRSALVSDVVGAADESWFDNRTPATAGNGPVAHELRLRRGGLLLGITLSGTRGEKGKDPRSALVDLAGVVLRRLPHVGAKDTGTPHKIQYEVFGPYGPGGAKLITWTDYTGVESSGQVTRVRLPWLHTVPMASFDGADPDIPMLHATAISPRAKIGCLIVVDGEPVAGRKPRAGYADCEGPFPDDGGTAKQPSAQPASATGLPPFIGPL